MTSGMEETWIVTAGKHANRLCMHIDSSMMLLIDFQ